jgi:hypothetical protein
MIATALLACTVAAAHVPLLQVEGDSRCPTASQVAALLPEMLPPTEAAYPDIARIEADGLDLQIELRSRTGEVLSSRRLRSSGTCEDLATIAAVVIASWSAERNPGVSLLQPGVPAAREPPPTPSPAPSNAPAVDAKPVSIAPRAIREIDLSAGIGGGLGSAGVVGAARVEAGVRGRRFGLRSGFWAETERSQTIEPGSIASRRYGLSLGPTLAMVKAPMMLETRAELFAGLTTVDGHHFDVDGRSSKLAAGLAGALRLGTASGWLRPWIDVGGQYWLADQAATITKPQQQIAKASLPSFEARLFVGVSVLLSR